MAFFNITYDLNVPSVFGICFGEAEYGGFTTVGAATRESFGAALRKVIQEIGSRISYFRYILEEKKNWAPSDDFSDLTDFDDHGIFYTKRPKFNHVFDDFRNAKPQMKVNFYNNESKNALSKIEQVLKTFKDKDYNVLVKDITTPDVNQAGFYALRVIVPQLLPMGGVFPFYFLGGKRLYDVPSQMGYDSHSYKDLNKFPHPFP